MNKFFPILVLLFLTSCAAMFENLNCLGHPTDADRETADHLYHNIMSQRLDYVPRQAVDAFACYYKKGDEIYSYQSMWRKGYVLVRNREAITYVESSGF